jgi:acyl-CoA reductase-like NAD-dependent aldehyde dehydrogenase
MSIPTVELLIDNQDVAGADYAEVRDPGRFADVVGRVAQADTARVDRAVQAAHRAFPGWAATPLEQRIACVQQVADLLEAMVDELTPIVVSETGMLPAEIRMEIAGSAFATRDNIDAARAFLQPSRAEDATSWVSVEKKPAGVIAGFVPWNAPIVLMIRKLAPALVCGNTLVIKTPPTAPLGIGTLLKRAAALFPPGVLNVVHGGNETGQALVAHPLVRRISFTGGGKAASAIMKAAAGTLKNVQFELGGNDPAIVLDDMDLDAQMPALVAGTFHRSGQFCFAVKRIYVPESIFEAFFARFAEEVAKFKIGHPLDPRTTFGPVNNAQQYAHVKELVARARQSAAEVVELGEAVDSASWDQGYYLKPVLVKRAMPDQEIVACEQFGPVVPVIAYRDEDHAVAMANDTEYGLGSSIWTTNTARAVALARRLETGMTFINRNVQSRLGRRYMPFGGVKQSGIGTENSELGLADYVEYHAINLHK